MKEELIVIEQVNYHSILLDFAEPDLIFFRQGLDIIMLDRQNIQQLIDILTAEIKP